MYRRVDLKLVVFSVALAGGLLAGVAPLRAATVDFEDLALAPGTHWNGPDPGGTPEPDPWGGTRVVGAFSSGGAAFVNRYNTSYGSWDGFAYSNRTDTTTPGYGNQFSAFAGSGAGVGNDNYGVGFGYVDGLNPADAAQLARLPYFELPTGAAIQSVRVTNVTYPALSMLNGDGFSKKFGGATGNDPDWFKLSVYGTDASGTPLGGNVAFYLADYRFADNAQDYVLNQWAAVDLAPLAGAKRVYFNLSSSDNGDWGMNTPGCFAIDDVQYLAAPEWKGPGGGDWANAANWTGGVPNGNTAAANLWGAITADAAVDLQNAEGTVKSLSFKRGTPSGNYTLRASAAGKLHLAADAGPARIEVLSGSPNITAPVVLDSNTEVTVTDAASSLALAGPVSGAGALVLPAGNAGRVVLGGDNFAAGYAGATRVAGGTLQLDSADAMKEGAALAIDNAAKVALGGASSANLGNAVKLGDLNLNGHATSGLTASLDLNQGKLIADKTQVALSVIRAQIKNAYAGGKWTGAGITSAAVAADYAAHGSTAKTGIGYLDNGIPASAGGGKTTWGGRGVDGNSLLVRYTYYGDANLDGQVNLVDFGVLKSNFGTGNYWHQADFNYDGAVNLFDFGKLKYSFGAAPIAAAAVPEPGAAGLLASAVLGMVVLYRRRNVSGTLRVP